MLAFILRRILQAAAVMLTVALLAFVLFQYVGDPVTIMLGQDATDAERVELRERLGLTMRRRSSSPVSSATPCRAISAFRCARARRSPA